MKISNKAYDILKYVCLTLLPALTTFYGVIGTTLQIPHTQEVLTIMAAFDAFLGTCLGVSSANYKKGEQV